MLKVGEQHILGSIKDLCQVLGKNSKKVSELFFEKNDQKLLNRHFDFYNSRMHGVINDLISKITQK